MSAMRTPFDWTHLRAALFDIDGTLIDSNEAHAQAWTEALRDHGLAVSETRVRALIGKGADKLLPEVAGIEADSTRGREIATRKGALFAALLPDLTPTPGARELLEYLKARDLTLGVATSAGDDEVSALLKQAGVDDLFQARASKDDAEASKPDPDIVQASLEKVGAPPSSAVLIGDTPYDIQSAGAAGVASVALRCGGFWPDEALGDARAIYDDPRALLSALKKGDVHAQ